MTKRTRNVICCVLVSVCLPSYHGDHDHLDNLLLFSANIIIKHNHWIFHPVRHWVSTFTFVCLFVWKRTIFLFETCKIKIYPFTRQSSVLTRDVITDNPRLCDGGSCQVVISQDQFRSLQYWIGNDWCLANFTYHAFPPFSFIKNFFHNSNTLYSTIFYPTIPQQNY